MIRARITTALIFACLVGSVLCVVSCQPPAKTPAELALEKKTAGKAPSAANITELVSVDNAAADLAAADSAVDPAADPVVESAIVEYSPPAPVVLSPPGLVRSWLMLLAILLILFLLSLILFHSMARRLRQKSFRAHAPTRHADIWASHKPPQFLDP